MSIRSKLLWAAIIGLGRATPQSTAIEIGGPAGAAVGHG